MNIRELQKKSQPMELITVKCQAVRFQYNKLIELGLNPDSIFSEAVKELYEQWSKDQSIKAIVGDKPFSEVIPRAPERGDYVSTTSPGGYGPRVESYLKENKGQYTAENIGDNINASKWAVEKHLRIMVHDGRAKYEPGKVPREYYHTMHVTERLEDVKIGSVNFLG